MLQELNNKFHDKAFSEHKYDVKSLGWGSKYSQEIRFEIIKQMGIEAGDSVLDVGCGFGDLYQYLVNCNLHVDYTGIDINPSFIRKASQDNHIDVSACKFLVGNLSVVKNDLFDWVVASGIFSFECKEWEVDVKNTIVQMFSVCKKGISFNILSSHSKKKKDGFRYMHPHDFLREYIYDISDKYVVRHDYKNNDFTVWVYK